MVKKTWRAFNVIKEITLVYFSFTRKMPYFRQCFNHHKLGKAVIKQPRKYYQLHVALLILHYTNQGNFDETFYFFFFSFF